MDEPIAALLLNLVSKNNLLSAKSPGIKFKVLCLYKHTLYVIYTFLAQSNLLRSDIKVYPDVIKSL